MRLDVMSIVLASQTQTASGMPTKGRVGPDANRFLFDCAISGSFVHFARSNNILCARPQKMLS